MLIENKYSYPSSHEIMHASFTVASYKCPVLTYCMLIQKHITMVKFQMGRVKRIWYLSPMRAAKVQVSLRIRAVSPEPPLLAHTSSESRGTRQKARSLAPLNDWACAVTICHDGMLEDTNSLDAAQIGLSLLILKDMFILIRIMTADYIHMDHTYIRWQFVSNVLDMPRQFAAMSYERI